MVINLKNKYGIEPQIAGNKAYHLNRLYQLNYNICDGYILTADFFNQFLKYNYIDINDENIIYKIQTGNFDYKSKIKLKHIFQQLVKHTGELIIRSSAIEEDSHKKSYAGIFDSEISIKSYLDMISSIKNVWCSYFSSCVTVYQNNTTFNSMPVIIQEMFKCDKSGVAFTINPVTMNDEIIIEACRGNNQKIISGDENAERYVIAGKINKCNNILSRKELKKLKIISHSLEKDFGYPCDFEWGIENHKLVLFQVRPIIFLNDKDIYSISNTQTLDCILLDRYANPASVCYLSLLESWQNKVYLSYYHKEIGESFDEKPLYFINNRVYWNVKYQKKYFEDDGSQSIIKKLKLHNLVTSGYKNWYRRLSKYDKLIELYRNKLSELEDYDELNSLCDEVINNFCLFLGVDHFRFLGIAQILHKKLDSKIKDNNLDKLLVIKYIGFITNQNKTVVANQELLQLVDLIQNNPKLKEAIVKKNEYDIFNDEFLHTEYSIFFKKFTKFIEDHGHRGIDCDDLYFPHWIEDKGKVLLLIKQLLKNNISKENDTLVDSIHIKNRKLKRLIKLTGEYMCLRENQRYYFDKSWLLLRQILLKLSNYYIGQQTIQDKLDIFHLTINEIQDGIKYKKMLIDPMVIMQRKNHYENAKLNAPSYIIKDSHNISVQKSTLSKSYKVMGISSGKAFGRIKIIYTLEDLGNIEKDDIGLVKTFHPSWTPILKVISGLIMNYGNMLSHGAVVAREYNIPVVVFNGDATKVLEDGDVVEINGTTGRIKVLNRGKLND